MKMTPAQLRVVTTRNVQVVGCDEAGRPVCEYTDGLQKGHRWAVKKDGDPTDIQGSVSVYTLGEVSIMSDQGLLQRMSLMTNAATYKLLEAEAKSRGMLQQVARENSKLRHPAGKRVN